MGLDAVVLRMLPLTLACIFFVGAWQKFRDLIAFEIAIEAYEIIPPAFAKPLALTLPICEVATAACLLFVPTEHIGALMALGLLGVVTAAVAWNLIRGRTDVGCGCGGLEDEQPISWALVMRNLVLAALAVATIRPQPLGQILWLDYFSIVAGSASLYGLYAICNQLIANAPRLARLGHAHE